MSETLLFDILQSMDTAKLILIREIIYRRLSFANMINMLTTIPMSIPDTVYVSGSCVNKTENNFFFFILKDRIFNEGLRLAEMADYLFCTFLQYSSGRRRFAGKGCFKNI